LISYEAFKFICDQLAGYGYKKPQKYYDEMMEKYNKFCILLCNAQKFDSVKEDILDIFKYYRKKESLNSSKSKEQSYD